MAKSEKVMKKKVVQLIDKYEDDLNYLEDYNLEDYEELTNRMLNDLKEVIGYNEPD